MISEITASRSGSRLPQLDEENFSLVGRSTSEARETEEEIQVFSIGRMGIKEGVVDAID